jgi:molybdate transport system substrate-binding protein
MRSRRSVMYAMLVLGAAVLSGLCVGGTASAAPRRIRLVAFVGSASKPPALEAKAVYEKKHPNVTVDMTFGGSGTLLNQMALEKTGDIYMPGSDDYMDKAEKQKAVIPKTRKIVAYLVPVICVQHGNPKHIMTVADMGKPGVTVGLAQAGAVCLGDVGDEILKKAGVEEQVKKNCLTYARSCEQTQQLIQLGEVDAIIGWDSFKSWAPDKTDIVLIPAKLIRVRNVPAAVSAYSKERRAAEGLIAFLTSKEGQKIFEKHGYCIKPPQLEK